ncbi:MAG: MarR family transcriptional regulator [Lachnospiraceae bacterium]|nr:MarR family transcriptional regulator [Lachnospiraceae bacterium]
MKYDRSIGFEVKTLSNIIKRSLENEVFAGELQEMSGMQGWIIKYLAHQDQTKDFFQKDIEKKFDIRRSSATGVLQTMERNGLIRREPVESDARLKKLVLTQKAIILHQQIDKRFDRFDEKLHGGISQEELEVFFRTIDKVKKNLE